MKRKLELHDANPNQTKITSYFEVMDKMSLLLKENKTDMLSQLPRSQTQQTDSSSVLHHLLVNIEKNICATHAKHRQHDEVIKKFATILYIYSGSMAYEFIHRNIPEGLPSLRTIQSLVFSQYRILKKGNFNLMGSRNI